MVTEKDRLLAAMHRKPVDRPPCICPGGMMNMITSDLMDKAGVFWPGAHTDAQQMASLAAASCTFNCFENVGVPFCMTVEAEGMGADVNMGSRFHEPHVGTYVIDSVSQWKRLKSLDFQSGRTSVVLDALGILKASLPKVPVIGNITGSISVATSLMEPVVFYKELRNKNKEAHELLTFISDQTALFAKEQIKAGADVIAISDPSGTGEIMGPRMFEEFTVKYLNKVLHTVHGMGAGSIVHICGRMHKVYEQTNQITAKLLSFDSVVPIKEAVDNLPGRSVMGNVSTYALEYADKNKIVKLTRKCIRDGASAISPACGLGTRSPLSNIQTMADTVKACNKRTFLDELVENGVFIENPCNGKGICGKCKVQVLEGELPELSETERLHLSLKEINEGIRLACTLPGDIGVIAKPVQSEGLQKVLTDGFLPDFQRDAWTEGYGLAVDIGTTTVVISLVRLSDGEELDYAAMINPQKIYGMDVLTRITYELEHPVEGLKHLNHTIISGINEKISELCIRQKISTKDIYRMSVAANTTMLHYFLGYSATSLGKAPYTPVFVDAQTLNAKSVGIDIRPDGEIYCLPSVSAFVGADITAGAYVCGLQKTDKNILFIDIGTNGEMILSQKGRMLSCSCAAGPALEGMNISCGMRAAEGAVEDIKILDTGVQLSVIGNCEPQGLCGSGILAAVRELLKHGLVKKEGVFIQKEALVPTDFRYPLIRLNGKKREFILYDGAEPLIITQQDIRQVQLAKGAILSGFCSLLDAAGLTMEQLDEVIIAGQFGAHLPGESLTGTGILPPQVENKIKYIGNTSKSGAYMALLSLKARSEMEILAKSIQYIELSTLPGYEKQFCKCLTF